MSRKETIQISCPNCGHRFQYDVWTFINADTEPYLKTALVTGLLNFTRCPKCGYEYFLALPLVYHEARAQRLWCHIPEEIGNMFGSLTDAKGLRFASLTQLETSNSDRHLITRSLTGLTDAYGLRAERETLALSMVEKSRLELNATLRTLGQALTPMQTETFFSYLESPRIFDDINEMIGARGQGGKGARRQGGKEARRQGGKEARGQLPSCHLVQQGISLPTIILPR